MGDLFAGHYLGLVRLAMRLVDDRPTAEDVVQDAFAHFPTRDRVDKVVDPLAYLRRSVLNGSRSAVRRRRVARTFALRTRTPETVEPAHEAALYVEHRQLMLTAIQRLPRRQREVIVLRFYEDLTVTDIAAVLNTSPGAVSSALNRALAALAPRMEKSL